MKKKTLVCSYGKNEPIEQVFERLYAMYVSNYSENYSYCALIDLPDAISYRSAGDTSIEEAAQKLTRLLNKHSGNAFFCAIRQRRFCGVSGARKYSCEEGAQGALKALWRYTKGKSSVLFPVFGCVRLADTEQIYFSGCGAEKVSINTHFNGVIEPNGISALSGVLAENDAVFAFTGEIEMGGRWENRLFEGLYTASALDKQLSCEPVELKTECIRQIGLVRYPESSFLMLKKESLLI